MRPLCRSAAAAVIKLAFVVAGVSLLVAQMNATGAAAAPLTPTALTLSGPGSAEYNTFVTFTAILNGSDGGGSVAFDVDGTPINGCQTNAPIQNESGLYQSSCTSTTLQPGPHVIRADYSGDSNVSPSSGSTTVTIDPDPTSLSVALPNGSPWPTAGLPITVGAWLDAPDGNGTVTFRADGDPVVGCIGEPVQMVQAEYFQALCTIPILSGGPHTIEASYSGDAYGGPSSASFNLDVDSTTVTGPVLRGYGTPVTFTATVTASDGTGWVTFSTDGIPTSGCTAQSLVSNDQSAYTGTYSATCTLASLGVGAHIITATYSGSDSGQPPLSGSTTTVVVPGGV
jgi:hypothetical protein